MPKKTNCGCGCVPPGKAEKKIKKASPKPPKKQAK